MFLVRSAFWLSAAFVVMAPSVGMDVGQAARSTGEQLVSRGAQAVSDQLENCGTMECLVGRAVITQAAELPAAPEAGETQVVSVALATAPFPPPRPEWAY